jgi:hypothetical protein
MGKRPLQQRGVSLTLEAPVEAPAPDGPAPARPVLDALIAAGGLLVAIAATLVTAVLELFTTTLRVGGVPIGATVLIAAAANWAIGWFAIHTVKRTWAILPPWGLWTVTMFFAATWRTTEGDYLVAGDDWVALVSILSGSAAFLAYAYRAILRSSTVTKI